MKFIYQLRFMILLLPLGLIACGGGGGGGGTQPGQVTAGPTLFSALVEETMVVGEEDESRDLSNVEIVYDAEENPDAFDHWLPGDAGS